VVARGDPEPRRRRSAVVNLVAGRVGHRLRAGALALAVAAGGAGCGSDTVSSAKAVETFNRVAAARDVKLTCPEELDKGLDHIDCTLQGTKTGKTAAVKVRGIDTEDDFLDAVDGAEFNKAVQEVTQP
jgi:hypothetical protein